MAPLMAKRRSGEVGKQYQEIGGGSPIRRWTDAQGKAMTELLDKLCPETGTHLIGIALQKNVAY
jgi:ferrochelatase